MDLLVLRIDSHRVGLESPLVQRVTRAAAVCPIPGAPLGVLGVLNVGGTLVPVFDLRARLGLPSQQLHPSQQVVLAQIGSRVGALVADEVQGLATVNLSDVDSLPLLSGMSHISGVAKYPDGLVLIQDLQNLLRRPEAFQLERALREMERS